MYILYLICTPINVLKEVKYTKKCTSLLVYVHLYVYICIIKVKPINNKDMSIEELNQMCREYQQVLLMSEEEACDFCNADSKADAVQAYEEEIEYWTDKYYNY